LVAGMETALWFIKGPEEAGRRRSVIHGVYLVIWSVLITGPLRGWEARLTEPIYSQALAAVAVGALIVLWWTSQRRRVIDVAVVVALVLAGAHDYYAAGKVEAPRDRVIVITIDTVRADHLSSYGYHRQTSPNLDRLAAGGVRFSRAFCPMGVTDPSHASMFTGVYPRTHGIKAPLVGRVSGYSASLAELFRDRGFKTAAITSRIVLDPVRLGITGFEHISVPAGDETRAPEAFRRAMNWLHRHRGDDAFVWVHFFDPHQPFEPHDDIPTRFVKKDRGPKSGDKWLKGGKRYSESAVRYRVDLYDEEIAYMDMWIGRLLEAIEGIEPKSERPPFVIVISDHGEILGELQDTPLEFGFGHGGILRNGVAHIPFIMSWPGHIPAGLTVDDVVEVVDLAPTVARLALGVTDFPAQGYDLVPLFEGEGLHVKQEGLPAFGPAFMERRVFKKPPRRALGKEQFVIVRWPYKLFYPTDAPPELFDLENDFAETNNLAPSRPDLVESLLDDWKDWKENVPEAKIDEGLLTPAQGRWLEALGYIQ